MSNETWNSDGTVSFGKRLRNIRWASSTPVPKPPPMPRRLLWAKPRVIKAQPVMLPPPLPPKKPRPTVNKDMLSGFIERVFRVISKLFSDPSVLTVLAIVMIIVVTHINDTSSGPLARFINYLKSNSNTEPLGSWLSTNLPRFVGFIIFIPVIAAIPPRRRTVAFVATAIWLFVVPVSTYVQYTFQALSCLLFFRLNNPYDRLMLAAIIVVLYMVGITVIPTSTVASDAKPE